LSDLVLASDRVGLPIDSSDFGAAGRARYLDPEFVIRFGPFTLE